MVVLKEGDLVPNKGEDLNWLEIANIILKSRMNQEVHVWVCEEQGVKVFLLTRLPVLLLSSKNFINLNSQFWYFIFKHIPNN
jgi:hypothetical protein